RNIVLPPFKACVDAGVATFMNGFNELNGMPVTGSKYLLDDILRKEWNYDGMVVSDWGSIKELVVHGVARDSSEAAQLAIIAGSDMDMEGYCYPVHLVELVRSGKVDEDYIDRAARRVLSFKYKLGLFDDPYKYCDEEREKAQVYNVEHRAKARELAREAMVLLKNEQAILPLDKSSHQSIAVIGELAADRNSPLGSWRAQAIPNSAVSLLDGIKTAKSNKGVAYAKGPDYILNEPSFVTELEINTTSTEGMAEAVRLAKTSDVVVLCLGEHCFQSGEARSQTDIKLKGKQLDLLDAIVQVNKNVVLVLMNGRPLDLTDVVGKVPAILETWHLGSESGNAIADVLFGDYNPSGKLPMTFPRNVGQCPIYYNHKNTGRPTDVGDGVFWSHYTDSENSPLFPFGYGLSYTSFDYSNFSVSNEKLQRGKALTVSVEISNVGRYAGAEVVQLYIRDHFASVAPPVCQLKGFDKVYLEVGESVTVTFELEEKDLAFYNPYKQEWGAEAGDFSVWVGIDPSDDLVTQFELL
ncbi:MAG: glycoside hydrolase family 3 C-terminal domain-containing protein, partial [Bacteroidales bacterium]|nr:glycoside hydrolase family 3 C-terminal domain-containing protein [Bacteroidales bacterium]